MRFYGVCRSLSELSILIVCKIRYRPTWLIGSASFRSVRLGPLMQIWQATTIVDQTLWPRSNIRLLDLLFVVIWELSESQFVRFKEFMPVDIKLLPRCIYHASCGSFIQNRPVLNFVFTVLSFVLQPGVKLLFYLDPSTVGRTWSLWVWHSFFSFETDILSLPVI